MAKNETWYGKFTVLPAEGLPGDPQETYFRLHVPSELLFHEGVAQQSNRVIFTRQQYGQDKHFECEVPPLTGFNSRSGYNIVLKPFAEWGRLYTREILVQQSGEELFFLEGRHFLKSTLRPFTDALTTMLIQ